MEARDAATGADSWEWAEAADQGPCCGGGGCGACASQLVKAWGRGLGGREAIRICYGQTQTGFLTHRGHRLRLDPLHQAPQHPEKWFTVRCWGPWPCGGPGPLSTLAGPPGLQNRIITTQAVVSQLFSDVPLGNFKME